MVRAIYIGRFVFISSIFYTMFEDVCLFYSSSFNLPHTYYMYVKWLHTYFKLKNVWYLYALMAFNELVLYRS